MHEFPFVLTITIGLEPPKVLGYSRTRRQAAEMMRWTERPDAWHSFLIYKVR